MTRVFENNQDEIIGKIELHAKEAFPNECCGIVTRVSDGFKYIKCRNLSKTPQRSFLIDPVIIASSYEVIEYIVHSHVNGGSKPSKEDIKAADELKKAFLIVSMPSMTLCGYTPKSIAGDIAGRDFFYGVNDCVTIAIDYHKEKFGVEYENPERNPYGWWEREGNEDVMRKCVERIGFRVVNTPENGDVVLMSLLGAMPSHIGIYEDGNIIHNIIGGTSRKELYSDPLRRCTKLFLRAIEK